MTRLYEKACLVPVWLAVACATPAALSPADWHGRQDPQESLDIFVTAWNAEDSALTIATFEPARRRIIRESDAFEGRFGALIAADQEVLRQCHPRGVFWKTAVITFRDRRSGASHNEIVWMHLHDGRWFMYSL